MAMRVNNLLDSVVTSGTAVTAVATGQWQAIGADAALSANDRRLGYQLLRSSVGPLHEILVYDRALSDAEQAQVTQYLAAKWGIQLGLWNPYHLGSALALWLDADDASTLTLNGSTVSQWRDKSGNARNLAQASAANQPTRTLNGMNGRTALSFNGTQWLFNPTNSPILKNAAGGSLTVVANYGIDSLAGSTSVALLGGSGLKRISSVRNAGNEGGTLRGDGRRLDADSISSPTDPDAYANQTDVIQSVVNNYTGNEISQFVNGASAGTATFSSGGGNSSDTDASTILVGGFSNTDGATLTSSQMHGLVSEVVLTQGNISALDRQRLEGYLAHKWGLAANLPTDHPFKTSPPTV